MAIPANLIYFVLQAYQGARQEPEMAGLSIEEQLELTAKLIQNLQAAQHTRLSAPLPPNLGQVAQPNSRELQLAERLVSGLSLLAGQAPPAELAQTAALRRAMGVAPGAGL